jgi:hypothetical protein
MTIPIAPSRRQSPLVDVDGLVVPIIRACAVPGCTVGQYIDPLGEADHQAAAGHVPVPGRPLCPVMGVGE